MQNETAKLTERWGAQIVICANAETLLQGFEIDVCDETAEEIADEMATAAVSALEDNEIWAWNESSAYEDWHGGRYGRAPVHIQWMERKCPLEVGLDELDEMGDLAWIDVDDLGSDWSRVAEQHVPPVLRLGMEALRSRIVEAMEHVASNAEARDEARADG
jgi:hypothetical protein